MEPRTHGDNVRKEKGHLSPIFNLSQNFRTHAGVLKLSQSIIELLYRFFPNSNDVLNPETSLIYGEPPILLESGHDENAIITIFENSGNVGGKIVGFGAEQVILVRDDFARFEISKYVRKQALILTILECKGLEFQLFSENNYEMAIMCFERAGDMCWKRRSKAACLKTNADRVRTSNPEEANAILREAAEIYDAIGKVDSAAQCFFDLGDYTRADKIYMERCNELEKAGECFCRAGSYALAADVYSKGNFYAECLAVCSEGKLFEIGLQYIEYWKQSATTDRCSTVDKVEHKFLESCAGHYYQLVDSKSMMKFVRAFRSMKLKRDLLNSLDSIDELLLLEEESGNFLEAANIAKTSGNTLHTVDLLGKAGHYNEACVLILSYVLSHSLWSLGSKGWLLKAFTQKLQLLSKAISLAKKESRSFYELVCVEADILSNKESSLAALYQQWNASKEHHSVKGEMLCARNFFDYHLRSSSSKYVWVEDMIFNLKEHTKDMICKNLVSIESLIYFWNYYRDKIVDILEFLKNLGTKDIKELQGVGHFCFNFLGVMKQYKENGDTVYVLLNSDVDWLRGLDSRYFQKTGMVASLGVQQLVSAARSYRCSEVLSVGLKLLDNLEALHNNSLSAFCQNKMPSFQFEVAMHLFKAKFLDLRFNDRKTLQNFIGSPTNWFFSNLFNLDWKLSLQENIVSLRGTEISRRMLKEVIAQSLKNKFSYGLVGRVTFLILGSGKLDKELFENVANRFSEFPPCRTLIEALHGIVPSESRFPSSK